MTTTDTTPPLLAVKVRKMAHLHTQSCAYCGDKLRFAEIVFEDRIAQESFCSRACHRYRHQFAPIQIQTAFARTRRAG